MLKFIRFIKFIILASSPFGYPNGNFFTKDTLRPDETADNLPYEKVGKNEPVCIADEVPFDIPDSWEWIRLGELCDIINGFTPLKTNPDFWSNGTIPWFTIDDVHSQGRRITFTNKHITTNALSKNSNRLLPSNTVLLCCTASVGEYAITEIPLTTNQQFNGLVIKEYYKEYYSPEFLFELVQTFKDRLINVAGKTTFNFVSVKKLGKLLIPILPLKEQERILIKIRSVMPEVKKYSAKEIEINELNIQFPNLLKKSILQEAVQGKLVPQDPADEPASVLLDRIRAEKEQLIKAGKIKRDKHESVIFRRDNSHYEKRGSEEVCIDDEIPFEIPDTWEWCRLGNILTKLTDGTHSTPKYTNTGIPFISVKDISSGKLNFNDCKYISIDEHQELYSRCNPELNDILLTKVGTTGIPVIVDTEKQFSLFVSVALLKFNNELIFNKYVVQLINSPLVQKQVIKNTRGVGNKNWVMRDIANTLIAIPPSNEQHRIVAKLDEYFILINQI